MYRILQTVQHLLNHNLFNYIYSIYVGIVNYVYMAQKFNVYHMLNHTVIKIMLKTMQ